MRIIEKNYVTFTTSVVYGLDVNTNREPDGGSEEEFLNTYKTMIEK
ncbi:hypothetical protein Goarm_004491 [Gossypium armourianum]|uniref:Uncharacterized protein n=1 Tax=Gossypium armourianum TaxID=34283 RepID=A0A7J9JWX5_9ROSI|nr:hypothetical protein [Gossypium armourianum]